MKMKSQQSNSLLFFLLSFFLSLVHAQNLTNDVTVPLTGERIVTGVLLIGFGIVMLFFGYKLLKPILFLSGFYLFWIIGYAILTKCEPSGGYSNREAVLIFGSLAFGLLGGLLGFFIFRLGLFFVGAFGGLSLSLFILSLKSGGLIQDPTGRSIFIAVLAIGGGIIIQFFVKPIVIICTSFDGAYSIVYGIDIFARTGFNQAATNWFEGKQGLSLNEFTVSWKTITLLVTVLVLFIIGLVVQFRMNRGFKHSCHDSKE